MIAKTFRGGRTYKGAIATIGYLLDERVSLGTARVLLGDSDITLGFIKEASKKQVWSWSSGVLSFYETLDDKTMRKIIADFERVFFCGMNEEQYNILWVNHEDKGSTELHYINARLELTTQKSFNPYFVKRDFNKKDLWQEKINIEYGFRSHFDNLQSVSKKKSSWVKDNKSLLKQIDEMIITLIKSNEITCRGDIIDKLREDFELDNIEDNFITIIDDNGIAHTLKGAIYGKEYTDWTSLYEAREERSKVTANGTVRELSVLNRSINEIVEKQTYGNQKNYGVGIKEKDSQIASHVIKLEPPPYKKALFESSTPTLDKTLDEEENNNKKDETNDTIRATIDRLFGRSREEARRRTKRISDSIRASREQLEDNKRAADRTYRVIKESLEIWSRKRRYREDFKTLFLRIEHLTQQFELIFTRRGREVERRFTDRNTSIERSFSDRNTAIIELIQNRLNPEDKLVEKQRVKNAEKRVLNKAIRKNNKPKIK